MVSKFYRFSDGFFTYYVNIVTGEKRLSLGENDIEVEILKDDFQRMPICCTATCDGSSDFHRRREIYEDSGYQNQGAERRPRH